MNERTLTALQGSIKKWEEIVAGTGEDMGVMNCPLCQEFYRLQCEGCPVKTRTWQPLCADTPYDEWASEDEAAGGTGFATTPELVALAQKELDFLRSLLPNQAT